MLISPDTQNEIQVILRGEVNLPQHYAYFLLKWLAYNRTYNETETGQDWEKAIALADRFNHRWTEVEDLVRELVSMECIGGERVPGTEFLKPFNWVKSATHYLRKQLELETHIDPINCQFFGCVRAEKKNLCNQVATEPWNRGNMAALMRLVYQVRCSLVHGEKRLGRPDYQTKRDQDLVELSDEIMTHFLTWINNDELI